MSSVSRSIRCLAVTALVVAFTGGAQASAFEAHNFLEPPFGTFSSLGSVAVDLSNGDVLALDVNTEEVKGFGAEGGSPAAGPSSFTGAGNPANGFGTYLGDIAVDNACPLRALSGSECTTFDPSSGDVYVYSRGHRALDKFTLGEAGAYEYVCEFKRPLPSGSSCLASPEEGESHFESGGVAVDSAGDVYLVSQEEGEKILEFNAAGEALASFAAPEGDVAIEHLTVAADGSIYATPYVEALSHFAVVEFKRSSLTGALEGQPTLISGTAGVRGLQFDQASGQLLLSFESFGEALNGAHEVVSRFGSGVIAKGGALAVDEASGQIYVANGFEQNIDRFAAGVPATLPTVDAPPPVVSDVTRTSALLSGTVGSGDATTRYQLEYAPASEYQPSAADPYAAGGSTAPTKIAPSVSAESVGPVPLTGLLAGTTYHYRLIATNELGTVDGPDHTFTTSAATPPVVTTGGASEVTQTGTVLSGSVGTEELQTSYVFEVGTDTSYRGAKLFGNAGSGGTEAVSVALQFLIPGTTYHYRLAATNADGTSYGQDMTFTTPGVPAQIVQPAAALMVPTPSVAFPSVAGAITKPRAKPLTKAQKLASALKACKRQARGKRAACERQARKRYGASKAPKRR